MGHQHLDYFHVAMACGEGKQRCLFDVDAICRQEELHTVFVPPIARRAQRGYSFGRSLVYVGLIFQQDLHDSFPSLLYCRKQWRCARINFA